MKAITIQVVLIFTFANMASADVRLNAQTVITFANTQKARIILGRDDEFIRQMSPFDRAARLKTDKAVSEKDFLAFVTNNILAWKNDEKLKVENDLKAILPELKKFSVQFPRKIYLIKTTGKEEGNAAYTRGNVIILPQAKLFTSAANTRKILAHEFFHILTRNNPRHREKLYNAIGFKACNEINMPNVLKPIKITNPDAPLNNHYIEVTINGHIVPAVPILFSKSSKYDPQVGGEFFDYLIFQLLLIEKDRTGNNFKPKYSGQNPLMVGLKQVAGYFEQVGTNTEYIIHPEEILADNFSLLITKERNLPSPKILEKMRALLLQKI